jgi:predicted porin
MVPFKHLFTTFFLLGLASPVIADTGYDSRPMWDIHPYVGIDYTLLDLDYSKKNVNMVGVVGGLQFNDNLGVELSYMQNAGNIQAKDVSNNSGDIKLKTFGIGVTLQADITNGLYIKSHVGFNRHNLKASGYDENEDVGHVKLGLGYQFTPDFAAEITDSYNFSKKDNATSSGFGIQFKYYF